MNDTVQDWRQKDIHKSVYRLTISMPVPLLFVCILDVISSYFIWSQGEKISIDTQNILLQSLSFFPRSYM